MYANRPFDIPKSFQFQTHNGKNTKEDRIPRCIIFWLNHLNLAQNPVKSPTYPLAWVNIVHWSILKKSPPSKSSLDACTWLVVGVRSACFISDLLLYEECVHQSNQPLKPSIWVWLSPLGPCQGELNPWRTGCQAHGCLGQRARHVEARRHKTPQLDSSLRSNPELGLHTGWPPIIGRRWRKRHRQPQFSLPQASPGPARSRTSPAQGGGKEDRRSATGETAQSLP